MSSPRLVSSFAAALALAAGVLACGGDAINGVVLRVGDHDIMKATVAHWMVVMAPNGVLPEPPRYTACIAHQQTLEPQSIAIAAIKEECRQVYKEARLEALDYLITSQWRREVEKELGLALPKPGNDADFESEAERETARISQAVVNRVPRVTSGEIAAYYTQNLRRYAHAERRDIEIVEGLPSEAAARSAMRKVKPGAGLSNTAFHEVVDEQPIAELPLWKKSLNRAIFAAKPHVLTGPQLFLRRWIFLEVKRIVPPFTRPLASVRDAIEHALATERRLRTLKGFIAAWRRKWIAKTDCRPEYIVQKCKQYTGPEDREEPLVFD